jgi:hypothetical protein
MITEQLAEAIRRLLRYSWEDAGFRYEELTNTEQSLITREQFEILVEWVKHERQ